MGVRMNKIKSKKISPKDFDRFLKDLESDLGRVRLSELFSFDQSGNTNVNYKMLAKELVQQNTNKFSTLFSVYENGVTKRRIERIYSRKEIRKLVEENLISEYQNDSIIDAVTEYLYGVHVSQ